MSIKRYELGPFSLVLRIGKPEYSRRELIENHDGQFRVYRQETENMQTNEILYTYVVDGVDIVGIRGFNKSPVCFHITCVENLTGDAFSGVNAPTCFSVMEDDLRHRGITRLTTNSVAQLAPILVRRYGFTADCGMSYERLKSKQSQRILGKAFGLTKLLLE